MLTHAEVPSLVILTLKKRFLVAKIVRTHVQVPWLDVHCLSYHGWRRLSSSIGKCGEEVTPSTAHAYCTKKKKKKKKRKKRKRRKRKRRKRQFDNYQ